MSHKCYNIDFFKEFDLEKPITGLVKRITSPKGSRTRKDNGFVYKLKGEPALVYEGKPMKLQDGLYWIIDICKVESQMMWNHYLFVLEKDGSCYPVAEYIDEKDSGWVRNALPLVKKYMAGIKLKPVGLSEFEHTDVKKSTWKR